MRIFRFLLILCLPAFLLNPIPSFSQEVSVERNETVGEIFIPRDAEGKVCPWELFSIENLSIDNYFNFIELLENEEFLETLTEEEFDDVVAFVISMVRYSVPKDDLELKERMEEDIQELLFLLYEEEHHIIANQLTGFEITLPFYRDNPQVVCCRGWLSKKFHHLGHFLGKHKKPLIIAAVGIGVVTIAVVTGGVGASSAVAIGGALVSASANNDHPKAPPPVNKPGEVVFQDELFLDSPDSFQIANSPSLITSPLPLDSSSAESIMETSREHAESTKVELVATGLDSPLNITEDESFEEIKEGVREKVSYMAHLALDTLAEITEYFYELNPSFGPEDLEAYLAFIDERHELIDELFLTGHASLDGLSAEERVHAIRKHCAEMQIGILPVPGVGLVKVAGRVVAAAATEGALGGAIIGGALTQPLSFSTRNPHLDTQIDERLPKNPDDLLKDSNWQEISHPRAKAKGHRMFENIKTGERLRYDEEKLGETGHKGESHWHRENPYSTSRHDKYLDANDNPVPKNSPESHLYPPE